MLEDTTYQIFAIGIIRQQDDADSCIEINPDYAEALLGLEDFSHLVVLYWLDRNDTPECRNELRIHPRGDSRIPISGVFATHSPLRPNPVAISICKQLSRDHNIIHIDYIDAFDESPVIDIKPYIPKRDLESTEVKVAPWVRM